MSALTDGLAALYGDNRRLIRELFEYDRAVTFMLAVCIGAGEHEDDPESWLTIATLTELAAVMGIGPDRRVRRFVEEMRSDGHLIEVPMAGDRRRYRLQPSERMLAIDREWCAAFHAPLALLMPGVPRYEAAMAHDPAYHRRYRTAGLTTLRLARDAMWDHQPVDSFLHQAGGARVLAVLMQSGRGDDDGWSAPGFYTHGAERSATTRAHVRGMLRNAASAGYVEIAETPTVRVRATRLLLDDYEAWVADSLSATDLVSTLTLSL
ncbi:MAG: hypothetical protein V4808_04465 [Pseudomonadota bacterium]